METFVTLKSSSQQYQIHLPNHNVDHIQKIIYSTKQPYEVEMLTDIGSRLHPGDLFVDIGTNIGNHSLYVASLNCRVFSYEPNAELVEILKKSIWRNQFENLITVVNCGLGRSKGTADFAKKIPENTGMQTLVVGQNGSIDIKPLDSFSFPQKVNMIKIDVEEMEMDVLCGAEKTIRENRPMLYIESQGEEFRKVTEFLTDLNYTYWDTFNATPTHLFLPVESVDSWWNSGRASSDLSFHLHRMHTRYKNLLLLFSKNQKNLDGSKD
jgi:FkbM family methyltransferase